MTSLLTNRTVTKNILITQICDDNLVYETKIKYWIHTTIFAPVVANVVSGLHVSMRLVQFCALRRIDKTGFC